MCLSGSSSLVNIFKMVHVYSDSVDLEFVPGYTRSEGIVRIVTKVYSIHTFFKGSFQVEKLEKPDGILIPVWWYQVWVCSFLGP